MTLKADAARGALDAAPDRADALLADLRGDAKQAIGDLRRVVYNLRPATLDELGLLGALGEQIDRFTRQGLSISLNAPAALPVLPAAVEVASYRIITEALTNVVRHAHARQVAITVAVDGDLCLAVDDDGVAGTTNGDGHPSRARRRPPLVRAGLQAALAPLTDVAVVAEAATGSEAIREAVLHRPDVVVMDLQMPDLNGIEATHELRREIARAITAVAAGEAIFDPAVATRVLAYFAAPPATPTPFPELTTREREVLDLIAAGHNNHQTPNDSPSAARQLPTTSPPSSPSSRWRTGPRRSCEHGTRVWVIPDRVQRPRRHPAPP